MLTYRLYFLDGSDRVVTGKIFDCRDDAEARTIAHQYVDGRALELWQDARLVARLEPSE